MKRTRQHARPRERKPDIRIEFPSQGETYSRPEFGVYQYDTYPRGSVLAGQQRRIFLDSFKTEAEAIAAYPQATPGCGCGHISIDAMTRHLPGDDDPDPFGDFDRNDW